MIRVLAIILFTVVTGVIASIGPAYANGPLGRWLTQDARSHIEIAPCGNFLCGTVRQLLDANGQIMGPGRDTRNPNRSRRNQPILGLKILTRLRAGVGGRVWHGRAYNPEDGKTYDVSIRMKDQGLEVTGCLFAIFCQSEAWSRLP